jgi:hypothetical protein
MSPDDVLQHLLERLDYNTREFIANEIGDWPEGILNIFLEAGLLKEIQPANVIECPGCEENCLMPVYNLLNGEDRTAVAFITCDKRQDIGRIPIDFVSLRRWRTGYNLLANLLAKLLDIEETPKQINDFLWRLGRVFLGGDYRELFLIASNADFPPEINTIPKTGPETLLFTLSPLKNLPSNYENKTIPITGFMHMSSVQITLDREGIEKTVRAITTQIKNNANFFYLAGQCWEICYEGQRCTLKDTKGLAYIAYLLQKKGEEIHVSDLNNEINKKLVDTTNQSLNKMTEDQLAEVGLSLSDMGDAGDILTPEGKKRMQQQFKKLKEQIEEAEELGDADKKAELEDQLDNLEKYVAAAYGLGGRSRKSSDPGESMRKSVTTAIKRALKTIEINFPALATHLNNSIKTGLFCSYQPENPITWTL